MSIKSFILRYWTSERAATAIEYGLIAAGISIAIAAAVFAFGDSLYELFYADLPGSLGTP